MNWKLHSARRYAHRHHGQPLTDFGTRTSVPLEVRPTIDIARHHQQPPRLLPTGRQLQLPFHHITVAFER
jgi:hypothetical protein